MVGETDGGGGECDPTFGLELLDEGRVDGVVGEGGAVEEAEADGQALVEAGEGCEFFLEVAGEKALGKELVPFFEVADVAEAAPFPVAEGGGAEAEKGAACPVAGVVLGLEAGFCKGRYFVTVKADVVECGAGGIQHGEALVGCG